MIKKIVSGGQTGADRAALDIAIKLSFPHGGWIPKGGKTEDGTLPAKYELLEMPTTTDDILGYHHWLWCHTYLEK